MIDLKHGDLIESKTGRLFRVVRMRRCDDAPDTFRLESLQHGTIGSRQWTLGELRAWNVRRVGTIASVKG